ncbi:NnrU family protein [Sphingomonas arenae]|uniref:NnrU family protein n=1 Tax=Sphingomonas arenae TaxID=2812555 RepID=UPI0019673D11
MSGAATVALFAAAFVATHLLLSHPLRAPLARRIGERGFSAAYSAVALATFVPMVLARRNAGPETPLWTVPDWAWWAAALLVWSGSILFVGSFRKNPAMVNAGGRPVTIGEPAGVFRITRHPMMWGFALWAIAHIGVHPEPSAVAIAAAILVLALGGTAGQDRKKQRQLGDEWARWEERTSFVPFGRGLAIPGAFTFIGGTILFLAATWAHPMPVGLWRWLA